MSELSTLPEGHLQRALERFRMLQPHLEGGRALTAVAREAGIPYRTAQRWVALTINLHKAFITENNYLFASFNNVKLIFSMITKFGWIPPFSLAA